MTLVEVIAALVLMAGTMTSLLLAYSRCLHARSDLQTRLTAAELAETLVQTWQLADTELIQPASGDFGGHPKFTWRRSSSLRQVNGIAPLHQIRLVIVHTNDTGEREEVLTVDWIATTPEP